MHVWVDMGFISSITTETKVDITFQSKVVSVVNGVPQPITWTTIKTVKGLFWTGSQTGNSVSDKVKTEVEGAIAIDYDATIAALDDTSRFVVNSENYEIIHIDNVGQQNEMLQIMYKREVGS